MLRFGNMMMAIFLLLSIGNVEAKKRVISYLKLHDVTYTGETITPHVKVFDQDGTIVNKKNYCMYLSGDRLNAGKVTVRIKGIRRISGEVTGSFNIKKRHISTCKLSGIKDYIYDGKKHDPNVRLTYHHYNVSYRIQYGNTKTIGKKNILLEGIGNFTGTINRSYKVLPPSSRILTMTKTRNIVHLTLKKVKGNVSYQLAYKENGQWRMKMTSNTHMTINTRNKGKYSFKVRTSKNGIKSAWSSIKRI